MIYWMALLVHRVMYLEKEKGKSFHDILDDPLGS